MRNISGKSIRLSAETYIRLEKLRHEGQSYDWLISELIDYLEFHQTSFSNTPPSPPGNQALPRIPAM